MVEFADLLINERMSLQMARKIKFALKMPGDVSVRTIEELKQNFDLASVLEYYFNGKLIEWLLDRKYNEYADAIAKLDNSKAFFKQEICNIFDVNYHETKGVVVEEVVELIKKRQILKEFTDDETILGKADEVIFEQQELNELLKDDKEQTIYLFGKEFTIPVKYKNKKYVGVNNPKIKMLHLVIEEIEKLNIRFENIELPDDLEAYFSKEEVLEEVQVSGRCMGNKIYHVSQALDFMLNDKERKNSEKIFAVIQECLGRFTFDVNIDSNKIAEKIKDSGLKAFEFNPNCNSEKIVYVIKDIGLRGCFHKYLERLV